MTVTRVYPADTQCKAHPCQCAPACICGKTCGCKEGECHCGKDCECRQDNCKA